MQFCASKKCARSAKKTVHCAPKAKSSIDGAAIVAVDNFLINDADGYGWEVDKVKEPAVRKSQI
jgi:hypothetical protein